MSDFYYINSENRIIDLTKPPYIGMKSNSLLDFKWDYITQGQAYQKIVKFEKRMVEKPFHIVITGTDMKDYYRNLDRLLQYTEVDINNLKQGRLYVGKYFLRCYLVAHTNKTRYLGVDSTKIEVTIVCENGNWQSEEKFVYMGEYDHDYGHGIDYPYNYSYDFAPPFDKNYFANESSMDAEFELVFQGPVTDPTIKIGDNIYTVYYTAISGECIKIDSYNKTVTHIDYKGDETNVFMYRDRDNYIFNKIRHGINKIDVDPNLAWELTLFHERSEPKWSDSKWI